MCARPYTFGIVEVVAIEDWSLLSVESGESVVRGTESLDRSHAFSFSDGGVLLLGIVLKFLSCVLFMLMLMLRD
jgi:hypothetical protein